MDTPDVCPSSAVPATCRRWRAPLLVGVAVVVILAVVGAGLGLRVLLGRGDFSSPAASTIEDVPSAWAEGSHQTWTLDVGDNAEIAVNGDQMVVGTSDSSYALVRVSAYDVSGAEPKKQWETKVDQDYGQLAYWGEWITIGGNQLLKASDGTTATAGWDADDLPVFIGAYALTCDKDDRCVGWSASAPATPLWDRHIDDSSLYMEVAYYNWAVHEGTLVTLIAQDTAVRLEDGALIDLEISSTDAALPLADGWLVTRDIDEGFRVLSPSGQQVDSFTGTWPDSTEERPISLFGSPRPTAEQMRAFLVDGDRSWAAVTSVMDANATDGCPVTLTMGEHTLVPAWPDGECVYTAENAWYGLSSDGSLFMHVIGNPNQTGSSVQLVGMWSVADGEPVSFAGSSPSEQPTWLASPELVLALDTEHEQVTAYAPGTG